MAENTVAEPRSYQPTQALPSQQTASIIANAILHQKQQEVGSKEELPEPE